MSDDNLDASHSIPIAGRRKPYTQTGIRRCPCTRCGEPARFQWQCCANRNRWLPLCATCDIGLNRLALEFMRVPGADALLRAYQRGSQPHLIARGIETRKR